ncbi:MAG: lipid-binding protein [Adhaeribacter sp.]|nr:lipid-binding protein [Adhaeribacter sp.]
MKTTSIAAGVLALALLFAQTEISATGNPIKKTEVKTPVKATTTLAVDPAASTITWSAKKVGGGHDGNLKLSKGTLTLDGNKLTGGNFVMDMSSITEVEQNARLMTHLKSDDFFGVEKNPTSTFNITKVAPVGKAKGGIANYNITGDLTIKGITHPITFPVVVKMNGNTTEATAKVIVDRLKYDIKFRSGIIGTAADKIIEDTFALDVKLVAGKSSTAKL